MASIYPLIICGGNGTRLWPVSRTQSPKQFQKVGEETSLTFFQSAVERHRGPGYERPCIVSAQRHAETVAAQLAEIDCQADILLEPVGRNTGPAVLAAALSLYARNPDALMVVIPADHVIDGNLTNTIMAMAAPASAGFIITFGIKPRYAETGFGYITDGGPVIEYPGLRHVERFIEKPPSRKARLLVESEIAYWASGLSMFAARTIIEEYQKFDATSAAFVRLAVENGKPGPHGFELDPLNFGAAAASPTEVTVFEKTGRIALAPLDVDWSDVGSWTAMYGISKSNAQGNVLQGDVIAVETTNSMVRSTSRLVTVVGMKDVIVIDTPDALLVTRVGHCQDVKKVAEYLKVGNRIEAEKHQPLKPGADISGASGLSQLFRSDSLSVESVRLAPGASLDLPLAMNRELVVARGLVTVSTIQSDRVLLEGERLQTESFLPTILINQSANEVEVVMLMMNVPISAAPSLPKEVWPMSAYA